MNKIIFSLLAFLIFANEVAAGVLLPGQGLKPGQSLYSDNGQYHASMQTDGNFVVYTNLGESLWSTNTTGLGANYAVMQLDGNFVLYKDKKAIWSSNTTYNSHGYAAVSDYGQFVVYSVTSTWSSSTSDLTSPTTPPVIFGHNNNLVQGNEYTAGQYKLIFQKDGNVVIYNKVKAVWSTNTSSPKATLAWISGPDFIVQGGTAGNAARPILFDTKATKQLIDAEYTSAYLAFQGDGNLVMYVPQRVFKSPSRLAPKDTVRHRAPTCFGPPEDCIPWIIPVFNFDF